jgi:hypothetical protein
MAEKKKAGWQKGQSGNPEGRKPDLELRAARQAAQETFGPLVDKAKKTLEDIMDKGKSESARVAAAQTVIERVYGKAPQEVQVDAFARMTQAELLELLPMALEALGISSVNELLESNGLPRLMGPGDQ